MTITSNRSRSPAVINPTLYSGLKRLYGEVKVAHQGVTLVGREVPQTGSDGKQYKQLNIDHWGESYAVCCNRCGDQRFRLHFSQRWGVDSPSGRNLSLVHCFNENCYEDYCVRDDLYQKIFLLLGAPKLDNLKAGKILTAADMEIALPGIVYPLDELEKGHILLRYLTSRGFDPLKLSETYRLKYCSFDQSYFVNQRLIIPIYYKRKLVGWQARYIGDLDWKGKDKGVPKYYTCPGMRKSQYLYNFETACEYPTGVVVEGVMDVWAFGGPAMSSLGDKMASSQRDLLIQGFGNKSLVILYDSESGSMARARKDADLLRPHIRGGVAVGELPTDCDPADLDRVIVRKIVRQQAREQGVRVSFRKPA